jgi:hypothetical protein
MDEGLEFPDGIGILTVQNEVTVTGQSPQAQVQGVQKSRGAVDAATLPTTGGGGVTGAAGAVLLALALLVRRGRGRAAATS